MITNKLLHRSLRLQAARQGGMAAASLPRCGSPPGQLAPASPPARGRDRSVALGTHGGHLTAPPEPLALGAIIL